ncbi:sugar transferase [Sphingomonas jaspsi]|uniref:sugar transferase n=1 Tax=Sphingomonas jaspsi TaxID=392409 RepID=UPI0004B99BFF|nr:sugar transferase [Sphingomonas jaspsi]
MNNSSPARLTRKKSIYTRQRFFLLGAFVAAVLLPLAIRALLRGGEFIEEQTWNALAANSLAVLLSMWFRASIDQYPGNRASYLLFPSIVAGHAFNAVAFLFTRVGYDRLVLLLGLTGHLVFAYALLMLLRRHQRSVIGIVPGGETAKVRDIPTIDWVDVEAPSLDAARECDALVADFSAELGDEWERFLADAALDGRIVYQVKQLAESLTGRVEIEHLSENSFGSLVPSRGYFYLKGVADWVAALISLPVALPMMLGAAVAIKLDGKGPILFRQTRVGHAGKLFTVYKFRTMLPAAEAAAVDDRTAAMTGERDPRITRVGAVLRRSRIDELPQIFNVLLGQMSWIGPRPEAQALSSWYTGEIPFYRYRHVVKPGISGWAQINQGHVADVDAVHAKLQYDFFYIKYFSPWLDLLIAARTVRTMLTGFGSK